MSEDFIEGALDATILQQVEDALKRIDVEVDGKLLRPWPDVSVRVRVASE